MVTGQGGIAFPKLDFAHCKELKAPRYTARSLKMPLYGLTSCLADYFTWPQVALTHHVVCQALLKHRH